MITDAEYFQIVSEVYDLSDYRTQKNVLLCNEAKKIINIENIVNRLYTHIKNNVTALDFGTIPKSKGVISKIDHYNELIDCIDSIHSLIVEYGEDTAPIDAISTAINNIKQRERLFSKAFTMNIECPIMLYNMTTLSIVSSVSLLISSSVEYIKNGHDSFSVALDKVGYTKSKDHLTFEYINQFNKTCKDGSIDKLINECIKNNVVATKESYEPVNEISADTIKSGLAVAAPAVGKAILNSRGTGYFDLAKKGYGIVQNSNAPKALKVVGLIVAISGALVILFKALKTLLIWSIHTRMKVSDWFDVQATYLQINAENMKYRYDENDENMKKAYQKQIKWVETFKKISNNLAIKDSRAQKDTKQDEQDDRQQDYDDYDDGGLF